MGNKFLRAVYSVYAIFWFLLILLLIFPFGFKGLGGGLLTFLDPFLVSVLVLLLGRGGSASSSLSSSDSSSESPDSSSEEPSASSSSSSGCCGRLLLVRSLSGLAAGDDAGGVGAISPIFV